MRPPPRLTPDQAELAQQMYDDGTKTVQQIAAVFGVPRSTLYGHLGKPPSAPGPAPPACLAGQRRRLGRDAMRDGTFLR